MNENRILEDLQYQIQQVNLLTAGAESAYLGLRRVQLALRVLRGDLEKQATSSPAGGRPDHSPSDRLAEAFRLIGEAMPVIYPSGSEWRVATDYAGSLQFGGGASIGEAFANLWPHLEGKVDSQTFIAAERLVGDI